MTDAIIEQAGARKNGIFTTAALQKGVAFVVLVALLAFFSIFTENFAAWNNMVNIMQATAVNGVLGVAVTFVIIAGGIDLAVGTMMTMTAVTAGLVLTNAGLPLPFGILGAVGAGALMGGTSGAVIAKLKITRSARSGSQKLVSVGAWITQSWVAVISRGNTNFTR